MSTVAELQAQRGVALDNINTLAAKQTLTPEEQRSFDDSETEIRNIDAQVERMRSAQRLSAATAQPVEGQPAQRVHATVERDAYVSDESARSMARTRGYMEGSAKTVCLGGMIRMLTFAQGSVHNARSISHEVFGESHPVTRALSMSVAASGGFFVPPDYLPDYIELLRAQTVVRRAGPRMIPMPRGTMTIPGQASASTAVYVGENASSGQSQPGTNQIVASEKKIMALVPISNDLMRTADPAIDALVRDDLLKVTALREDLAFLVGDGTQNTPRGMLSFANSFAIQQGGSAGLYLNNANSTAASGGNFITSSGALSSSYNQAIGNAPSGATSGATGWNTYTANNEISGLGNKLDKANVPNSKRVFFMHPTVKNFLYDAVSGLGTYMFREEMDRGTLRGCPYFTTTQMPNNLISPDGSNTNGSLIFHAEMTECIIFDVMNLEIAVSMEGTYTDASGNMISAFANDQTLLRAVSGHDFQMRHASAIAVDQFVPWTPAFQ